MMKSFDDILIIPQFSDVPNRNPETVKLDTEFLGVKLKYPFISSNMDTVTDSVMANALGAMGAIGALHRFCTVEENVEMFKACKYPTLVSVGVTESEKERAMALINAGATLFLIDVAHGASQHVVDYYEWLRKISRPWTKIVVGNFADANGIREFKRRLTGVAPDAWKIGIGGGSMCTTRVVTGCGMPTMQSVIDCATTGEVIIADGGIRNSGDAAKALALGANMLMMGSILAGTTETPGELLAGFKSYRGSASASSYSTQGKTASHRTPEGEETFVPKKGPVSVVIEQLAGGIRSAMSYSNSFDLPMFRERVIYEEVSSSGQKESGAHGKK